VQRQESGGSKSDFPDADSKNRWPSIQVELMPFLFHAFLIFFAGITKSHQEVAR
jgi:hypothetical protein